MDNISVITLIDLEHEKLFNKYTNEIKTTFHVHKLYSRGPTTYEINYHVRYLEL